LGRRLSDKELLFSKEKYEQVIRENEILKKKIEGLEKERELFKEKEKKSAP